MSVSEYRYQTIREREGKTKKITQKEFVLSIGHGQYYPPEGVAVFQEDNSPVVYFMGGARHKKPAHWAMSNYMFRVTLEKLENKKNSKINPFEIIHPSQSKTSSAPKLAFASVVTICADKNRVLAFSVNGKNLDLRSPEMALSNEINVYETLPTAFTTYRTTTYQTPSRAADVPINSMKN